MAATKRFLQIHAIESKSGSEMAIQNLRPRNDFSCDGHSSEVAQILMHRAQSHASTNIPSSNVWRAAIASNGNMTGYGTAAVACRHPCGASWKNGVHFLGGHTGSSGSYTGAGRELQFYSSSMYWDTSGAAGNCHNGSSNDKLFIYHQAQNSSGWINGATNKYHRAWRSRSSLGTWGSAMGYHAYMSGSGSNGKAAYSINGYYRPHNAPASFQTKISFIDSSDCKTYGSSQRTYCGDHVSNGRTEEVFSFSHHPSWHWRQIHKASMASESNGAVWGTLYHAVYHATGASNGVTARQMGGHNNSSYGSWQSTFNMASGATAGMSGLPGVSGLNASGSGG